MMKKSYEIRLEKAKKREEERLQKETMMRDRPKEYLDSLYKER